MVQKAYVGTSPNLNCFDKDEEKNVKFSLFVNHYEIQSNFVLSKTFGLYAGLNGCFSKILGGEVAGIYYRNFNDHAYFEVQGGYGYFSSRSTIENMPLDAGSIVAHGNHFSQNSDTYYQKIYTQPAFFYKLEKVNWGFALKISANYFSKYHYDYEIYNDTGGDYNSTLTYSNSDFRYKWGLGIEPAVRLQFKSKVFLQLSGVFTSTILNTLVYSGHYSSGQVTNPKVSGQISDPQHVNFVFTIGIELKDRKRK